MNKQFKNPWYQKNNRYSNEFYSGWDLEFSHVKGKYSTEIYMKDVMFSRSYLYVVNGRVVSERCGGNPELAKHFLKVCVAQKPEKMYDNLAIKAYNKGA